MPAALIALTVKKTMRRQTQDCRDDRDKIGVDLETAEKTAHDTGFAEFGR